jgi:hypothetical protein
MRVRLMTATAYRGCFVGFWRDASVVEWVSADADDPSSGSAPFRRFAQGAWLRCRGRYGRSRRCGALSAVVAASAPRPDPPSVRTLGGDGLAPHFLSFGAAQPQGVNSIGAEH